MAKGNGEQWGSRLGVILAVAGSAVGLGNFLRFPGQAAQHGGGAFMVPYLIALLVLGIPIGWMEWTLARTGGLRGFHSAPGVLGVVGRGRAARYLGVLGVLIPLVVCMYYALIESWCLRYFWEYLTGSLDLGAVSGEWAAGSKRFFTSVTGIDQDGVTLAGGGIHPSVVFLLVTLALNLALVFRGLSKGIEKFCNFAMPVMAVCAVVVLVRVLTLGTPDPSDPSRSVIGGLGFMWNPQFEKLGHFDTWLAAAGQIFFSLSVGFGVILNYASYLSRRDDLVLSGLTASATNEIFEVVFGGLITIPAAFVFLGASGALGGTFGLGFNTLPVVFAHMGGLGRLIGALWFFMLFLAAITSSLSMLQPAAAFFEEALGWRRQKAVPLVGALVVAGSLWNVWYSKDLVALDTLDFWVGTMLIFVLAMVQSVVFGWVYGADRGYEEMHRGAHIQVPHPFKLMAKYVTPLCLVVVFVGFCIQSLPGYLANLGKSPVAQKTVGLIVTVLVLLVVVTVLGERRWRRLGMDLDGARPLPEGQDDKEGA
jgi:SNF family Na+-dependent transporter